MEHYEQRIHRALRMADQGLLQLRLAAVADRDLAIAVECLGNEDRNAVLVRLPAAKARRVEQERAYLERLRFTPGQRRMMAVRLADAAEGRLGESGGTWIAPGRRRKAQDQQD